MNNNVNNQEVLEERENKIDSKLSDEFSDYVNSEKKVNISRSEIYKIEERKRVKYLLNEFFKSDFLIGKINKIIKDDNKHYAFIKLVQPENTSSFYMLDNKVWSIYCNFHLINKNVLTNLKDGSLIYFKPKLDNTKSNKELIIKVNEKTVKELINYKEFLKELKIRIEDVTLNGTIGVEERENVNLWASREFYKSLEFLHDDLFNKLIERSRKLDKCENEISEQDERKSLLKEELVQIEEEIRNKKKEIENLNKVLSFWGFEKILNNESNEYTDYNNELNISEIIDYLRKYLMQYKGLEYNTSIIRRFLLAIKSNELTILSGPSGTGKTSLVNGFSEAIGGVSKIISVKPSWTETEDLIGFYNPIEQSYISTPFLDAIIEAKKEQNRKKLYLICLDEMNIAHVEYYFAEFLSKLELDKDKRFIELYSEETYKEILSEVINTIKILSGEELNPSYEEIKKWCIQNDKKYTNYIIEIRKKVKFLKTYPAKFEIPNNIRFIGTMNIDHTTKVISPKVIDRSFIIELTQDRLPIDERELLLKDKVEQIFMGLSNFSSINDSEYSNEIIEEISKINDIYLKSFLCNFNYRSKKHMINYLKNSNSLKCQKAEIFSDMIYMKVLPRINCVFKNNDEKFELWSKFNEEISENLSQDLKLKIEKMNRFVNEQKILSFWSVY